MSRTGKKGNEAFQAYKTRYKADYYVKWFFPQMANRSLNEIQIKKLVDTYDKASGEWGKDRWKVKALRGSIWWASDFSVILMVGGTCTLLCLVGGSALVITSAAAIGIVKGWSGGPLVGIEAFFYGVNKLLRPIARSRATICYFFGLISACLLGEFGYWVVRPSLVKKHQFMVRPKPPEEIANQPEELAKDEFLNRWGRLGLVTRENYIKAKLEQQLKRAE